MLKTNAFCLDSLLLPLAWLQLLVLSGADFIQKSQRKLENSLDRLSLSCPVLCWIILVRLQRHLALFHSNRETSS